VTTLFNDPAHFTEDMVAGFVAANRHVVRAVRGGVVRRQPGGAGKVAIVIGGGSGHYPAFCGTVGPGFADGAVIGNVFTSPSADYAVSVARAADTGGGVVFSYGNYAGDVMNFGLAQQRLNADGIKTMTVLVTDDIASAPPDQKEKRRGIAGDFTVFKVLSAAAEEGLDIDAVVAAGEHANDMTRSMGVAFAGCTMPGAAEPLFTLPKGIMGVGLGIHGEPGVSESPVVPAADLAALLIDKLLAEQPPNASKRVAVILNGLGRTKYEELFVVYASVDEILTRRGYTIVEPEVGELVTSLDMAGCSLTITWLDDDLERWWKAPALSAAYVKGVVPETAGDASEALVERDAPDVASIVAADTVGQSQGRRVAQILGAIEAMLADQAEELGRIDAVAGDGDHGRGMVKGAQAAAQAAAQAVAAKGDGAAVLRAAGEAWASQAGGTSGVLWGAGLEAFGRALPAHDPASAAHLLAGAQGFLDTIMTLGKAHRGDKTMIDALAPFVDELAAIVAADPAAPAAKAWAEAAPVATAAAARTAELTPKVGRARPLAERSIGTPDAGATSMGMIIAVVADQLKEPSP